MPKHHTISGGDSVESVAYDNGHFWQTLWDHGQNAGLRELRDGQPNILEEGDSLFVPDLRPKQADKPTDQRHRFRRKGVPSRIEIRLTVHGDEPRPNLGYTVKLSNKRTLSGQTDADGCLRFAVMPDVRSGVLTLETGESWAFDVGSVRPIALLKGVQGRLRNMGYYHGPIDGQDSEQLQDAVREFQARFHLPLTGETTPQTIDAIESAHQS